jgi:uncharacterized membrane protein YphA (DoxX/SURF4 family)
MFKLRNRNPPPATRSLLRSHATAQKETSALPAPDAVASLAGALEVAFGLLLVIGLLTQLAALTLAAGMTGAIVISGLRRRVLTSLTLAPLLLVAMISVIRRGAGSWSPGRQLAPSLASGPGLHPGRARHHLVVRPDASGDQRRS